MNKKIAIILPRKEGFAQNKFGGAVNLYVNSTTKNSKFLDNITIYGGATKEPDSIVGLNYKFVPSERNFFELSNTKAYCRNLVKILKNDKPDLIEVHNRPNISSYLHKYLDIPICQYLHNDPDSFFNKFTKESGRKKILQISTKVFCVSKYVKNRLHHGFSNYHNSEVIYNGLDLTNIKKPSKKNTLSRKIIFVGRIIEEKGALELAKALQEILPKFPSWKACFIGQLSKDKKYRKEFLDTIKTIDKQCIYKGVLDFEKVKKEFIKADIAVLPSYCNEAFGRTILEAILYGNAVITCANGGITEIADDNILYAKNHNIKDLVTKLTKLITDHDFRNKIIADSFIITYTRFDIKKTCLKLDLIRKKILS
jgi:glycosyltransferase involved in cell wall biosynthesis